MTAAQKFIDLAGKCGAKVHSATLIGKWLHIDTNKADEPKIREMLQVMKPKSIKILPPGADGKHLDGSRHHRIVAVF